MLYKSLQVATYKHRIVYLWAMIGLSCTIMTQQNSCPDKPLFLFPVFLLFFFFFFLFFFFFYSFRLFLDF